MKVRFDRSRGWAGSYIGWSYNVDLNCSVDGAVVIHLAQAR